MNERWMMVSICIMRIMRSRDAANSHLLVLYLIFCSSASPFYVHLSAVVIVSYFKFYISFLSITDLYAEVNSNRTVGVVFFFLYLRFYDFTFFDSFTFILLFIGYLLNKEWSIVPLVLYIIVLSYYSLQRKIIFSWSKVALISMDF